MEIIWKGPLKEDDREAQISVMENFISRGVSGIVLAPLDDVALRAPVATATRRGIPVVIIDSDLKSDAYASFVATGNYRGGRLGAQKLAELLDGDGRVVMLRCLEGSASTTNREQGFLDCLIHPSSTNFLHRSTSTVRSKNRRARMRVRLNQEGHFTEY